MFSHSVCDNIACALMYLANLFRFVEMSNVMDFETDVIRFGRYEWRFHEFNCRCIVCEHNCWLDLWMAEVLSILPIMHIYARLFGVIRILAFTWTELNSFQWC